MSIKFAVLRTQDGHATDPLRPEAKVTEGVGGYFEVLTTGKSDAVRVSVDGVACEGRLPRWKADRKPGKATITIEQVVAGKIIDTAQGEVMVGQPADEPTNQSQSPTK